MDVRGDRLIVKGRYRTRYLNGNCKKKWKPFRRKEKPLSLKRYVIVSEYGELGYYKNDCSRHVRKLLLSFRYEKVANRLCEVLTNRSGIKHWSEERIIEDGPSEEYKNV